MARCRAGRSACGARRATWWMTVRAAWWFGIRVLGACRRGVTEGSAVGGGGTGAALWRCMQLVHSVPDQPTATAPAGWATPTPPQQAPAAT